jgi:carotenoid cleavage dioxygenase-like enzyme
MTFTPDYRYMFVSIQHPDATNATVMKDAADSSVIFNRESAIVIARRGYLGKDALPDTVVTVGVRSVTGAAGKAFAIAKLYPNPSTADVTLVVNSPAASDCQVKVYNMTGALAATEQLMLPAGSSTHSLHTAQLAPGTYHVILTSKDGTISTRFVKQ